jgi:hypothetical protein
MYGFTGAILATDLPSKTTQTFHDSGRKELVQLVLHRKRSTRFLYR